MFGNEEYAMSNEWVGSADRYEVQGYRNGKDYKFASAGHPDTLVVEIPSYKAEADEGSRLEVVDLASETVLYAYSV